ncbi:MAG: hypothetical protein IJX96_03805, partial [Clostridia bacterium]|nr:hypothetical protein [Clostridia bacterium]
TYIDAYVLASSLNTEETETYRIYAHNIWLSFTYEDETSGSVDFTVYTSSNTSLKTPEDFYNALGYIKVCAVGTPSAALSECYFAVTMTTTDGYYFKVNGKKITVKSIIDSIYEV